MNNSVIYIKNLPASYDANTIEQLFSAYGKITNVSFPIDKKSKQPKGYAFVTFKNAKSALLALEKNNEEIEGKTLIVEMTKDKTPQNNPIYKGKVKDTNDK